ncbi:hypothetical protein P3T76_002280 [Phytophthora citrophthora]|uniref:Uncharacterized protein n=1 Tax=Phytophthora citrophthora TaxID=4793 RepID=A0AAD9GZD0_9STRA|nr:hypothetical protein P3T76_002278 [Phytophthora citrophthora]KAK1946728.1 hypothetical protein P3T76_002280 [Phytophthora citrophthora]
MVQRKHPKNHGKRQAATFSGSHMPATTQSEKLPVELENLKVRIQDLQTTTAKLQASVESLKNSIKMLQYVDERYRTLIKLRLFEEYMVKRLEPVGTKSSLEYLPTPEEAAQVVLEAEDDHFIELYKILYGVSPHLYV